MPGDPPLAADRHLDHDHHVAGGGDDGDHDGNDDNVDVDHDEGCEAEAGEVFAAFAEQTVLILNE